MSLFDGLRHRVHVLLRGDAYTLDVLREMRFHRDLDALAGRDALGNETYYREEVHRLTPLAWLERIRQDVRYAVRGLRRSPGFTIAVVCTLALGIGVNAAMFSLLRRLFVVPPSGVAAPNELRRLYLGTHGPSLSVLPAIQYPRYAAMRRAIDPSVRVALFSPPDSTSIRDGRSRITLRVSRVNDAYFHVLGVRPAIGRFFDEAEARPDEIAPVVVLSDRYWRRVFGANPGVVGRRVTILNAPFTIIGVAPRDFDGTDIDAVDAWVPMNTYGLTSPILWYQTMGPFFKMIVRPESEAAQTRMRSQAEAAIRTVNVPGYYYDSLINVLDGPIVEAAGPAAPAAPVNIATRVAGVAGIVLVIVCANVMNLLLLRSSRRAREIAVRRALGVSRTRLAEQMVLESLVLAMGAGIVAVLFAIWAASALRRVVLAEVHWAGPAIDGPTVAAVAAISVAIALVTGLVSAMHAMRPELSDALKSATRGDTKRSSTLRAGLLVVQAALSLALVSTAGLFMRSFDVVESIGVGYDTRDRMFVTPLFDEPPVNDNRIRDAYAEAMRRLRDLPGVEAVGAAFGSQPVGGGMFWSISLPGVDDVPQLPGDYGPSVSPISPGYLAASGLRLIEGRDFATTDDARSPGVVLVGESMARLYWPGERALGKCIRIARGLDPSNQCRQVVGVVADAHRRGIIEPTITQWYIPLAQSPMRALPHSLALHVTPGSEGSVRRAADDLFRELLPDLARVRIRTFDRIVEPYLRPWRLGALLFAALGVLAIGVAAIGIYSVVAYAVSQRGHEMAVRIALGAQRRDVMDLVLRDGFGLVAVGIAIGIGAALIAGRLVASLLFGVVPNDVSVLLWASIVICVVGATGCLVPGWRASRADPVDALRAE